MLHVVLPSPLALVCFNNLSSYMKYQGCVPTQCQMYIPIVLLLVYIFIIKLLFVLFLLFLLLLLFVLLFMIWTTLTLTFLHWLALAM